MTNLPPGVSPGDLPGNRPQDRDWEDQLEMFSDWLAVTGLEMHQAMDAIIQWAERNHWQLPQDTGVLRDWLEEAAAAPEEAAPGFSGEVAP